MRSESATEIQPGRAGREPLGFLGRTPFGHRLLVFLVVMSLVAPAGAQIAVRAGVAHPVSGPAIENAVIVIEDGKISAIGPSGRVSIPEGFQVLEAAVVTPGLVDAHATLGLSGAYNSNVGPVRDQDQLDTSAPIQPELRAIDAYNAREELIEYARGYGVTTVHTGHGPGALMSGQTLIAKTTGDTVEDAVIEPGKMIAVTLGNLSSQFKTPGTRAKAIAMLRAALLGAEEYREGAEDVAGNDGEESPDESGDETGGPAQGPSRDLRKETLAAVLDGEIPLLVTAQSAVEIAAALRLQRELGFEMILDGAAEGYLVLDEIREAGVPVILHPAMARLRNKSFESAKILREAGIPFALQTGYEGYVPKTRVLLFEAAIYRAHGLSEAEALASITLDAARILGVEDRVGSLEVGKDGDLALFSGDPFEYTTQVCGVVIEGVQVSDECH